LAPSIGAQSPCYDTRPVDAIGRSLALVGAPAGASLWLHKDGVDLYERSFGGYAGQEVISIASATKWLSAAAIMSLVDDGLLALDDTAGQWLANYTGPHGRMTIRQMLSHTAGMPASHPAVEDPTITLAQAVDQLASVPLVSPPGMAFTYGGVSMHVAGRIAEVAAGKPWAQLFAERVAGPCGMSQTDYAGLGATLNPRIGGGARSTMADYGAFLKMLLAGGTVAGRQVLSASAIDEILRDQTRGVPILSTPHLDSRRYGLGCWTDRVDGTETLQASSQGAFGWSPWLDRERGLVGIVGVQSSVYLVLSRVDQLQAWTYDHVHRRGVTCVRASTPFCAATLSLATAGPAVGGAPVFRAVLDGAPAGAFGAFGVGARVRALPTVIEGAWLWLDLSAIEAHTFVTDGLGRATFAASLVGVPAGLGFGMQAVVVQPGQCAGDLRASQALWIDVQ